MYGSVADFVSTRPDIIANQPNFNRMQVRNGEGPPGRQLTIPGENEEEINRVYGPRAPRAPMRLQLPQADMQQQLQPAVPPVRKAAEDLLEEAIAQVTPKNMGYGFESDMGGTFGDGDGVYIRGTFPEEERYRQRQYEQMKDRVSNPLRGV